MPSNRETVGGVFHLKRGDRVIVTGRGPTREQEVEIVCEGHSRTRGNRHTLRISATAGMKILVVKTGEGGAP